MKLHIVEIAQSVAHSFGPMRGLVPGQLHHIRDRIDHIALVKVDLVAFHTRIGFKTVFPVSVGVLLSDYEFGGGNCQALIRFVTV